MIKYYSQIKRTSQDEPTSHPPTSREDASSEADPTAELETIDEQPKEAPEDEPEKDSIKFKLWAEKQAKEAGYTIEVVISSSNKSLKIIIDDSTDIITQKDAIKLAVALDNNEMSWHLMDDPIVKGGGTWILKFSKVEQ